MAVYVCTVSFRDRQGVRHGVDIEAESVYEAALVVELEFRRIPFARQVPKLEVKRLIARAGGE